MLGAVGADAACPYPGCPAGTPCNSGNASACSSQRCLPVVTGGPLACVAPSCVDTIMNGYETNFDCGGGCVGCSEDSGCNAGQDCRSGVCGNDAYNTGVRCRAATCEDGVQNGEEVDVDCGMYCCNMYGVPSASCPVRCANGLRCATTSDCAEGTCMRLPRLGGGLFCSARRAGDTNPLLVTRYLAVLRAGGKRKTTLHVDALRGALAHLLDVAPYQVAVDALVEEYRAAQWGIGAYGDIVAANAAATYWPPGTPDAPYFITNSDTVTSVLIYLAVTVDATEGAMMAARWTAALADGVAVPDDGWGVDRVRARLEAAIEVERNYCDNYINASTVGDVALTVVNCSLYANTSAWYATAPSRRRLGDGSETAYAAPRLNATGGDVFAVVAALASAPRYNLSALLRRNETPPYNFSVVTPPYLDTLSTAPSTAQRPTELLVTVHPRGVPGRRLTATQQFAVQPALLLVDRSDRPVTLPVGIVTIKAYLDPNQFPSTGPLQLYGMTTRQLSRAGTVVYTDLSVSSNDTAVRIWFSATFIDELGVTHVLKTSTQPFAVAPKPLVVLIIPERVPLNPWLVAFLTLASLLVLFCCIRRRADTRAAYNRAKRVFDLRRVVPVDADTLARLEREAAAAKALAAKVVAKANEGGKRSGTDEDGDPTAPATTSPTLVTAWGNATARLAAVDHPVLPRPEVAARDPPRASDEPAPAPDAVVSVVAVVDAVDGADAGSPPPALHLPPASPQPSAATASSRSAARRGTPSRPTAVALESP